MIIKTQYFPEKHQPARWDAAIECRKYTLERKDGLPFRILVDGEDGKDNIDLVAGMTAYIMNDSGRTIEVLRGSNDQAAEAGNPRISDTGKASAVPS